MNTIYALIALSFLILVHELGHFIAAKLSGIKVLEFAIFMGPELFSFQKGETKYTIRAIPIGGYVKMEGEEENSDDPASFRSKPVWKRAIVSFAGSGMNLVLGFVLFFILISSSLLPVNDMSMEIGEIESESAADKAGFQVGDKILRYNNKIVYTYADLLQFIFLENSDKNEYLIKREKEKIKLSIDKEDLKYERYMLGFTTAAEETEDIIIQSITTGSAVDRAELKVGDRITMLDGNIMESIFDIQDYLKEKKDNPITITYIRDEKENEAVATPEWVTAYSDYPGYGLSNNYDKTFINDIKSSFKWTYSSVRNIYYTILKTIKKPAVAKHLGGPVAIIGALGGAIGASKSFSDFIMNIFFLLALISVNLGIVNLLPIPALDGSKLVILGVEKIRKKPLPAEKEAQISMIGFALLITMLIVITLKDLNLLW
jgi:regulator of sigma E protease